MTSGRERYFFSSRASFILNEVIPMNDKFSEGKIDYRESDSKIVKWFRNYWYYYKWIVIGIAFALAVIVFCTVQTCSNGSPDITILYAGTFPSADSNVPEMAKAFEAALPEDYNGDGKKDVSLAMLMVYSEEQIKAFENNKDENTPQIDRNKNATEYQKFQNLIVSGEYYVCLLEPWLFDTVNKDGMFMPLSEVLGYELVDAVNDYAIRLSDTEFGRYYASIKLLPEDTYLCIRAPGAMQEMTGKGKKSKSFERAVATIKAIIEFEAPEESK